MFIGNLVKLKDNIILSRLKNNIMRERKDREFIERMINKDSIWLITSMDNEDLDYIIQPLYLDDECSNIIQLGGKLLVLYDEIEIIKMDREELFKYLYKLACNN